MREFPVVARLRGAVIGTSTSTGEVHNGQPLSGGWGLRLIRVWLSVGGVLAGLGVAAWASDFVTRQGERTIFTADCVDGRWVGRSCSGKLVAGERYRYRVVKPVGAVVYWVVGETATPGTLPNCVIRDGRNWRCPPGPEAARSITVEMAHGVPVLRSDRSPSTFSIVPKWRWYLLRLGL
jgi:hypothetical protein